MPNQYVKTNNAVALVLGGYVNGYSVIRELHECGVNNIWLFDYGASLARNSEYLSGYNGVGKNAASIKAGFEELHRHFSSIVVFPTDDLQLELLADIYDEISSYCFLPFNRENLLPCLDKRAQYEYCETLGIPYPKTKNLSSEHDFLSITELLFPIIVKPSKRDDLITAVFRNMYLETPAHFVASKKMLLKHIQNGVNFLASECVVGDDTKIYAYVGYRSKKGRILNEWVGKKLNQFPDRFGIFSSASNDAPEIVREQGRVLLEGMNLMGIAEPEFKFDERDGQYKLMEVNLRSMMWHRLGNLSGVNIHYTQWLDALELPVHKQQQKMNPRVHFVYMQYELINLLTRKKYWRHFRYNVFGGDVTRFAVFDRNDLKPFFYDLLQFPRGVIGQWLKVLFKRSV